MSYTSNKAKPRENPTADSIMEAAGTQASQSNQERQQPQSSKFRTVDTSGAKFNSGNQVRVQGNTKGTNVVGRPSSIAVESRKTVKGAVENPDGQRNRGGKY